MAWTSSPQNNEDKVVATDDESLEPRVATANDEKESSEAELEFDLNYPIAQEQPPKPNTYINGIELINVDDDDEKDDYEAGDDDQYDCEAEDDDEDENNDNETEDDDDEDENNDHEAEEIRKRSIDAIQGCHVEIDFMNKRMRCGKEGEEEEGLERNINKDIADDKEDGLALRLGTDSYFLEKQGKEQSK